MGKIIHQTKSELRRLPLMLGKLAGGIAAVIGFTGAVLALTRQPGPTTTNTLLLLLWGCLGVATFLLSSRALTSRSSAQGGEGALPAGSNRTTMNLLAWGLLLLFGGIFLACVYFLTE